jgi:outer membrane receptor protein involved in Fe transport
VVYTLRGVGFNSQNFSAPPTVSVSVDEVPLQYPAMTQGAILDLARVEVLKGPQGTLFGQNSTGGQINYVAAKPTKEFSAGVESSFGRFNWWDVSGYVSGPVSDSLKVRVALSHDGGSGWQKSASRDDKLGSPDRSAARLIAEWAATDQLRFTLNLNGWKDQSDSQAVQFGRYTPSTPPGLPKFQVLPSAPRDNRVTDWDPEKNFKLDTRFYQPSLRIDYDLPRDLTITSISAYSDYKTDNLFETDGTQYENIAYGVLGDIQSFTQELRLAGSGGRLHWIVGGNYSSDNIGERQDAFIHDYSSTQNIGGSGIGAIYSPAFSEQEVKAKAGFANLEFDLSDQLTLVGGARYTKTQTNYRGCNLASGPPLANEPIPGVTSSLTIAFNNLYHAVTGNFALDPVTENGCITLDDVSRNGAAPTFLPTDSSAVFSEHNVAWNATLNFKPDRDSLLYARIAKGYKSGGFPTQGATLASQEGAFKQESILAYEAGFKLTLLDRTLQLDGAAFYYDYQDKQLSGYIISVFGPLQQTVNVPKSAVQGAEIAVSYVPVEGLTLSTAATYLQTEVKEYQGIDIAAAGIRDFAGTELSFAPKWSGTAGVEYRTEILPRLYGYVGVYDSFRTETTGVLGSDNPYHELWGYNLIDANLGVETEKWSAQLWGKNVFNKSYVTNAFRLQDNDIRVTGLPATYGIRFGYRY